MFGNNFFLMWAAFKLQILKTFQAFIVCYLKTEGAENCMSFL